MTIRGRHAVRLRVDRLIDGLGSPPIERAAILIIDGRIAQVGPDASVSSPENALTLDFPEGSALPGLIDSHVHLAIPPTDDPVASLALESDDDLVIRGAAAAERMLRAGVTSVFDCGGRGATTFRVRDAIARGLSVGPRLLVSGRPVTPRRGHCWFLGGEAGGIEAIRSAVRRAIEDEGADGIKIMATGGGLTSGTDARQACYTVAELSAAADEAHRRGCRITAHAHGVPGIRAAVEAGIDSVAHVTMLGPEWTWTFDQPVADSMATRGVRAVTTIAAGLRAAIDAPAPNPGGHGSPKRLTRADWWHNARKLLDSGVVVVPGSDVGMRLTDFGEEMLLELEANVGIGVAPLEVIRMATSQAARHLGIEAVTGSLVAGLAADVLVVSGRPDRDISALRTPLLVLKDGKQLQPTRARSAPAAADIRRLGS